MKTAVLGLGSIGRRHASIVRGLGHETIAYDPRPDAAAPAGVARAVSEREALAGAGAAIIATPPSEHLRQARLALDAGAHTLVEKPFAPSAAGVAELGAHARERGLLLRAAMNLRFHPGVSGVRRLLADGAIGRPLRASVWCGHWLPAWRPDTDYRTTYSARRELGGGVLLDAIHELDYAIWLFGPVVGVRAALERTSSLELDVEDTAILVLEHAAGTVTTISLDYLDHAYHRGCRVIGEHGTVHWSWEREEIVLDPAHGASRQIAAPAEAAPTYRAELVAFLEAAAADDRRTTTRPDHMACTAAEAATVLEVADAARRASAQGPARLPAHELLALRDALPEDSAELLRWRNDPLTRAASFDGRTIAAREHAAWLQQTLGDSRRRLLIATEAGLPVGQVRLDRIAPDCVEIHIGLAPEARGRGLAGALLTRVASELLPSMGVTRALARVKSSNEASRRSFASAGFRRQDGQIEEWWLEMH